MAGSNAKKEEKKVLDEYIREACTSERKELSLGAGQESLNVKTHLKMSEAFDFVNYVYSLITNEERGEYTPETKDFAIKLGTIIFWTNAKEPKKAEDAWRMIYTTDLFNQVYALIDHSQFEVLLRAIDEKISYFKERMGAACASEVRTLISKMEETMNAGEKIFQEIETQKMTEKLTSLAKLSESESAENSFELMDK